MEPSANMHTLGEMANSLNRPAVYLAGLQNRFELPTSTGASYSDAYLTFLRTVVYLRILNISEESLRDLWHFEKKLLHLLHVDSTGSPTWFLDACGQTNRANQRLLLSNYDLGVKLPSGTLQLGLNFSTELPELFASNDMGEDALRVLREYLKRHTEIKTRLHAEVPLVRAATNWSNRLRS